MNKQKALHFQLGEFLLICFQNVNFSTYNGVDYTISFLLKVHKGKKNPQRNVWKIYQKMIRLGSLV